MGLRIRFQYQTGSSLGFSIERLSDGLYYDFTASGPTAGTFTINPISALNSLPEDTGNFVGRYKALYTQTPVSEFTDGGYCITIHNVAVSNLVVAEMEIDMRNGDDAPLFATQLGAADPWSAQLPGSYPAGSAGAILGSNLDTKVSTRSSFSGGPVASVSAPVTVGTNNDKTGYSLSQSGLDAITIETGVNARQAFSPILAAAAGTLSGAGTGTILIKGGNVVTTRITATSDSSGNRTSVTLALPT
jgi:hypothetical protein